MVIFSATGTEGWAVLGDGQRKNGGKRGGGMGKNRAEVGDAKGGMKAGMQSMGPLS